MTFWYAEISYYEIFVRWNFHKTKFSLDEIFIRPNFQTLKFSKVEIFLVDSEKKILDKILKFHLMKIIFHRMAFHLSANFYTYVSHNWT